MHLLDTKMKAVNLFLTPPPIVISIFVARGRVGIIFFFREMKHANLFPEIQGTIKS